MGCSGKKCHERITKRSKWVVLCHERITKRKCVVLERSVMKESHREVNGLFWKEMSRKNHIEKLMCCSGKKCHERIT